MPIARPPTSICPKRSSWMVSTAGHGHRPRTSAGCPAGTGLSSTQPTTRPNRVARLADTGTGIAAAEYIGQRRGQEEGNQNPGDEEIKEHGVFSLRSPIFKYEAEDR